MEGLVLWITGLPGSGKSTVANGIKERFPEFVIMRMDELRKIVTPEPTYSEVERDIVYRCIVFISKILSELGHNVLIDATANRRKWRDLARDLIPNFKEIYLRCPLEICLEREKKRVNTYGAPERVYEKAKAGWPVPGLIVSYEEPLNPDLIVETDKLSIEDVHSIVIDFISNYCFSK